MSVWQIALHDSTSFLAFPSFAVFLLLQASWLTDCTNLQCGCQTVPGSFPLEISMAMVHAGATGRDGEGPWRECDLKTAVETELLEVERCGSGEGRESGENKTCRREGRVVVKWGEGTEERV